MVQSLALLWQWNIVIDCAERVLNGMAVNYFQRNTDINNAREGICFYGRIERSAFFLLVPASSV